MEIPCDALIIGAGPAGAATAILLRLAGWRVVLVEKSVYPRQKVCGECISAGGLALLDELGVGAAVSAFASAELRQVGWMGEASSLAADLPSCGPGRHQYGRALGRDLLDKLLVDRARELGVTILQPAKVKGVWGEPGNFECEILECEKQPAGVTVHALRVRASVVIDAHGSWDAAPGDTNRASRHIRHGSDLFGFKASFTDATLPEGNLPVLAFAGGYGGMVIAERGRLTLAGCIRRDTLRALRQNLRARSAGSVFEQYLRNSCPGVQASLKEARQVGSWLTVGPLRLGMRRGETRGLFRVGNAAGEMHPLIGEGMHMALESAFLLSSCLQSECAGKTHAVRWMELQRAYELAWRRAFVPRMRVAAAFAQLTMRSALHTPTQAILRRWPSLLTHAAQLAGKTLSPYHGIKVKGTS